MLAFRLAPSLFLFLVMKILHRFAAVPAIRKLLDEELIGRDGIFLLAGRPGFFFIGFELEGKLSPLVAHIL